MMLGLTATKFLEGLNEKPRAATDVQAPMPAPAGLEPLAQRLFRVAVAMLRQAYNNDQKV